jgi:hypothetical protein
MMDVDVDEPLYEVEVITADEEESANGFDYDEEDDVRDVITRPLPIDGYKVKFSLSDEDYSCTRIHGEVLFKNPADGSLAKVGTMSGRLLDRDALRTNSLFIEACDGFSQDLYELSEDFFKSNGTMKGMFAQQVRNGLSPTAPDPDKKGFLYFDEVVLDKVHRGHDVGLYAINAFLQYALEFGWPDWSLCMTYCVPSVKNRAEIDPNRSEATFRADTDNIAKYLSRIGFQRAQPFTKNVMYITCEKFTSLENRLEPKPQKVQPATRAGKRTVAAAEEKKVEPKGKRQRNRK